MALRDDCALCVKIGRECAHWASLAREMQKNIRRHLWDAKRQKFIPHVYLEGSPFPADFNEAVIYYHGGTACAIQAELLNSTEVLQVNARMKDNQDAAGARTTTTSGFHPTASQRTLLYASHTEF